MQTFDYVSRDVETAARLAVGGVVEDERPSYQDEHETPPPRRASIDCPHCGQRTGRLYCMRCGHQLSAPRTTQERVELDTLRWLIPLEPNGGAS